MPIPVSETICGLLGALSVTERVAVLTALVPGEKATVIRQLLFGGKVDPLQLSLPMEKSAELVPAIVAAMLDSGALPVFVRVTIFNDILEMSCVPKSIVPGARLTDGVAPFPRSEMD